jgi:hypothetical protein
MPKLVAAITARSSQADHYGQSPLFSERKKDMAVWLRNHAQSYPHYGVNRMIG